MIKELSDFKKSNILNEYDSMLLDYNKINENDYKTLFPDLEQEYDIESYLQFMAPINNGDKFLKIIKENKDKKFCIIGDYDCDGIMATVIMCYGLTLCGIKTTFSTPDRFLTGYGMKKKHVDDAIKSKSDFIITVDNGITANDSIDYAHAHNIKVLVTDHHTPQDKNNADLCIDPLYNNDSFKGISGATVAMKLIYLLYKEFNFDKYFMYNFVALAALTCFSDVMPVLNENRILINVATNYMSQEVYKQGSFINRLAHLINFYDPNFKSDPFLNLTGTFRTFSKANIDFYFVPIINAVNRVIGNVNEIIYDIMNLFCADFSGVPTFYSDINNKRKFMKSELIQLHKKNNKKAVVEVLNPGKFKDDYSGITGLVASSVVENEKKPALIGVENYKDIVHFSGISVSGFDLFSALTKIKNDHPELTFQFGGHAEALGAAIPKKEITLVENYLSEEFSSVKIEDTEETYLKLPDVHQIKQLYLKYYPFGNKFNFPKIYCEGEISYLDYKTKIFTITNIDGNKYKKINVKYFTKNVEEKIKLLLNKKIKNIKCIVSLMDDNNNIFFKLEKFL